MARSASIKLECETQTQAGRHRASSPEEGADRQPPVCPPTTPGTGQESAKITDIRVLTLPKITTSHDFWLMRLALMS